jgi:hypothetical protein
MIAVCTELRAPRQLVPTVVTCRQGNHSQEPGELGERPASQDLKSSWQPRGRMVKSRTRPSLSSIKSLSETSSNRS